jgi:hypothetical protein
MHILNCFLFRYRWVSCIAAESKLCLSCEALLQVSDGFEFAVLYWVKPEFKCRSNVLHIYIFEQFFCLRVQLLKTSVTQTASFQSLLVCSLFLFLVNVLCHITSSVLFLWFMHLVVNLTATSVQLLLLEMSHLFRNSVASLNTSCEVCVGTYFMHNYKEAHRSW